MSPGLITGFQNDDPQVHFTTSGRLLTVEMTTYGNSCRSKGEIEVDQDVEEKKLVLSPFDRVSSDPICLDILRIFEHSTTIELSGTGSWVIVVSGQDLYEKPVEFEFALEVDP